MADLRILTGDCREALRELADRSVHMCVTSPPFWGLRDYGTGTWDGGDQACEHRVGGQVQDSKAPGAITTGQRPGADSSQCKACGAVWVDQQLGLEKTLDCLGWATKQPCGECYICRMVSVFEDIRRVLRDDGTAWVNMGDSMSSGNRIGHGTRIGYKQQTNRGANGNCDPLQAPQPDGLKPKDLCLVPSRLALALQAAGWYIRSDIAYCKRAPMPESVTDRPTSAWEHVFLLAKNKRYFYDAEAVRQADVGQDHPRSVVSGQPSLEPSGGIGSPHTGIRMANRNGTGANLRNFWLLSPEPYSAAHFAVFPTEIPRRAILAGTSARGVCPTCGSPWKRVVEKSGGTTGKSWHNHEKDAEAGMSQYNSALQAGGLGTRAGKNGNPYTVREVGWSPTCACPPSDPVPATVLDPFAGSGTTGKVALELGRSAILIELNPEYVKLTRQRTTTTIGLAL